ncbi:putative RING-H2 finger protein ATL71 [Quercus suber]|uniref:putative RING-H2 finger protein ATL71 n=1 Tax=Quercus suber TaxID=58331 RepID=UPI0032DEA15F
MGLLPNGVEAALGILVLPIVVSIGYFCDGRMRRSQEDPNSYQRGGSISSAYQDSASSMEHGLNETNRHNFPKLVCAQAKLLKSDSTASRCSICLEDYDDSDTLRMLPDCGHLFHLKCVNLWLQIHHLSNLPKLAGLLINQADI